MTSHLPSSSSRFTMHLWFNFHKKFKNNYYYNMSLIAFTLMLLFTKSVSATTSSKDIVDIQSSTIGTISTPTDLNDKSSDSWTQLGSLIKNILGSFNCLSKADEVMDRIIWCWDNFDTNSRDYSSNELVKGAGCCLFGQFTYCVNERVKQICIESAANVTKIAVSKLKVLITSKCLNESTPYPTDECDALLFPSRTLEGIFGLLIAVTVFTLVILSIASMVVVISKRSKHREHYQAL